MDKSSNKYKMMQLLKEKIQTALGKPVFVIKFLGYPVFSIRKRTPHHTHIHFFGIPLFRIINEPAKKGFSILLLTWLTKALKAAVTGWKYTKTNDGVQIFFGKIPIYQNMIRKPFQFPTAQFHG